jgi:fatty-acyl-CoA synthase
MDDEPVFVQYSSGSTRDPHGCVLRGAAIAAQLSSLERALGLDAERDRFVAWLPLSHDMGMFGCLLLPAYWTGTPLVLSTPSRFVTRPQSWFADCARFGATISCAPNFALELAARTAKLVKPKRIPMRRLVVRCEPVDVGTLRRASAALGPERLAWEALLPAYGLAETVLAATMTPTGEGPTALLVDRDLLSHGDITELPKNHEADSAPRSVTSCGVPLDGVELDLMADSGVGEIRLRSSSLADGYLSQPHRTAEHFTSAGLLTGDLGFLHDQGLYVTGRKDDLLVLGGRNVYARDIEAAVTAAGSVRPGSCAVVQVRTASGDRLVAVAEPIDNHPPLSLLAERMATVAMHLIGVRLSECVFLPRGMFPKTPSGKTQRFRCCEIAEDRRFSQAKRVIIRRLMTG